MKMLKYVICAALMLGAAQAYAKTEKITIQGSVGNLSAVLQTPDGIAEGENAL